MITARESGFQVYQYFVTKLRQAGHRIPRNSCYDKADISGEKHDLINIKSDNPCIKHGVVQTVT